MIGLGSYAFFWQQSEANPGALSLAEVFEETVNLGINLFQICDFAPLDRMSDLEISEVASKAKSLGLEIELGTKGIEPARLRRYLEVAKLFDAKLVRSMIFSDDFKPSKAEAIDILKQEVGGFESAGVVLAIETYEQISTSDLVEIMNAVDSPNLGICLDPANVVARLENPKDCVELVASWVRSVHAKDFEFSRHDGWVGFSYSGAKLGSGLHDYGHLLATVKPRTSGINEIIEHWISWQGSIEATIAKEKHWTRGSINYLRSTK
jgi:sugar phosphate isomerase/epimerase